MNGRTAATALFIMGRKAPRHFPIDLLVHIMKFVSSECGPSDPVLAVGTLSWVCKRWRAIALDNPLLWTHIHMTPLLHLISLFLERSKEKQLSIHADASVYPCTQQSFMRLVLPHMSRIRDIRLTDVQHAFMSDLPSGHIPTDAVTFHVPSVLRTLDISCSPDYLGEVFLNRGGFGRATAPITLEMYALAWALPWLSSNLTSLSFVNTHNVDIGVYNLSVPHWLDVLSRVPSLRTLHLEGSIRFLGAANNGVAMPSGLVRLKNLGMLYLADSGHACYSLLKHIEFPSSATVSVDLKSASFHDLTTIMEVIGQRLYGQASSESVAATDAPILRFLSVDIGGVDSTADPHRRAIQGWESRSRFWGKPAPPGRPELEPLPPNFCVSANTLTLSGLDPNTNELESMLSIVKRYLPLTDIWTLNTGMTYELECEYGRDALLLDFVHLLPNLRLLELCGGPEHADVDFMEELHEVVERKKALDAEAPSLTVVYMHRCPLADFVHAVGDTGSPWRGDETDFFRELDSDWDPNSDSESSDASDSNTSEEEEEE